LSSTTTYYVTETSASGCASSASAVTGTVSAPATANAGPDQTVPQSATSVTLNGSVGGGAAGGTWTGGGGTFSPNANTLNATYSPTAVEKSARTLVLTLTSTGQEAPCGAAVDTMTITFNSAPAATSRNLGVGQGDAATLLIIGGKYAPTDADNDALTVSAVQNPSVNKATVAHTSTSVTVDYSERASFSGADSFTYTVSDGYGGSDTKTVYVTVYAPSELAPNIKSITQVGNTATITAFGIPTITYKLQYTTSLATVNWQDVGGEGSMARTDELGVCTLTDTSAIGTRYYRTKYVSGQ
jgi:hypothetical protein